jgi:predicted RNase H-like HicB family nuclease
LLQPGETAEETLANARDAILLTIDDMRDGGDDGMGAWTGQ